MCAGILVGQGCRERYVRCIRLGGKRLSARRPASRALKSPLSTVQTRVNTYRDHSLAVIYPYSSARRVFERTETAQWQIHQHTTTRECIGVVDMQFWREFQVAQNDFGELLLVVARVRSRHAIR